VTLSAAPAARRSNVVLLGWAAFWSGMAQEMIYPLLPVFVVVALGASKARLGAVEGGLAVGVTVARLATGRAVDRGGSPLRLTRASYALSLLARPLLALAPSVAVVGALRVVDGLGKGGKDAPRDVLVAVDAVAGRAGRSFGLQRMLDTLGSVAGPLVAGAVLLVVGRGEPGLRVVFALAALPAVGAAVQLARAHDAPPPATPAPGVRRARLPRPFWVLLGALTVFGLANSSDTLLLLRARSAGLGTPALAFLYAAFNLAYALLALPAGALSDRVGRRPLLLVAWSAYVLTYAGFAVATSSWQVVGLFLLYGVYYAAGEGTVKAWITTLVPADRRGAAYGLAAAAAGLLVLPASVLAGVLWDRVGPRAAFLTGSLVALAALAVLAFVPTVRDPAGGAQPAGGHADQRP
jgi:MFS family permease